MIFKNPSQMFTTSKGSTSTAASVAISGMDVVLLVITTRPTALASTMGMPNPSNVETRLRISHC